MWAQDPTREEEAGGGSPVKTKAGHLPEGSVTPPELVVRELESTLYCYQAPGTSGWSLPLSVTGSPP